MAGEMLGTVVDIDGKIFMPGDVPPRDLWPKIKASAWFNSRAPEGADPAPEPEAAPAAEPEAEVAADEAPAKKPARKKAAQ